MPRKYRTETWFLLRDNAIALSVQSIREFLANKKIPVIPHPLYSPVLARVIFFPFLKLKSALKDDSFKI